MHNIMERCTACLASINAATSDHRRDQIDSDRAIFQDGSIFICCVRCGHCMADHPMRPLRDLTRQEAKRIEEAGFLKDMDYIWNEHLQLP